MKGLIHIYKYEGIFIWIVSANYITLPTGQVLFKNLRGISVAIFSIGDQIYKNTTNLTKIHELIVSLFGFDMQIYSPPA